MLKGLPLRPDIQLTRTQRKIIEAKNEIYFQPQPDADDLTYSARELVQATLPHQTPRGNPPEWVRRNGNYTLRFVQDTRTMSERVTASVSGIPLATFPGYS